MIEFVNAIFAKIRKSPAPFETKSIDSITLGKVTPAAKRTNPFRKTSHCMKFLPVLLILLLSARICPAPDEDVLTTTLLQSKSPAGEGPLFQKIGPEESGVEMRYEFDPDHPLKRLYAYGWATGNVAIGDIDGDGRADLFFPGTVGPHRLFLQRDNFRFEDVSSIAQIGGEDAWGSCAVLVDIENDGDLDIYVVNYDSPNQLLMNISRGGVVRFTDMAKDYRIDLKTGALSASFVDFDNDGYLDLYLQTYHLEPEKGRPEEVETKVEGDLVAVEEKWKNSYLGYLDSEGRPRWVEAPLADRFFRNNGKGQFFPEPKSNLGQRRSYSAAHTWWDFDHNLRPDLYLSNDSHMPDLMLRNRDGKEVLGTSSLVLPYIPWMSRGGIAADWNNDLLIDFFATGSAPLTHLDRLAYGEPFRQDVYRVSNTGGAMQVPRNALLENTGAHRFRELAQMAGVANTGAAWASLAGDYDGDGLMDLFLTTGSARDWTSLSSGELIGESLRGKTRWDILAGQPERREQDLAFRNLGDWQFEDASKPWGLDFRGMSYSAGQGDLDGDGDLDLVVCPLGEDVILYRNQSQANRIVVDLRGEQTNRFGIGAEVIAGYRGKTVLRQLYPTGGFKLSNEPAFFLGMGEAETIDRLTVRWPVSGALTTLTKLKAGNRYTIREAYSVAPSMGRKVPARPLFIGSNALAGAGHLEPDFDDYSVQPLLPRGVSRTGPALAATDIDQDGYSELAIGGSKSIPTRVIARSPRLAGIATELEKDTIHADAGLLFFDANNNGNPDLFIGSGAVESGSEASQSQDRLYLGASRGFLPAPSGSLPESSTNTGALAACDFDRDGDVDVFAASRFAVGKYPEPGESQLLQNDGSGKFTNVISQKAKGLASTAAISSAIWSDVDNDGWRDLLLATQWGPIQLWRNRSGILENDTEAAGLSELTGLWNGITGGDIDNDGDIDFLVTNEGLNSGKSIPTELFRGDFLKLGSPQLIETVREGGRLLPKAGWLDLAELKPDWLTEYSSSRDFVEKVLPEYFSDSSFETAQHYEAGTLETGLLINDGTGVFTFEPLPRIAQVSTSYGCILTDVNADGFCDAWIVQNRASPTIRQPDPENAGVSQLFMNTGKAENRFLPISPEASGLIAYGAARAVIGTDLNNDDRVDLVASIRNNEPAVFLNQSAASMTSPLKVRLDGSDKHPAGARVTVSIEGFPIQTAEYYAGGGYLSQSPPELFFATPKDFVGTAQILIQWADGTSTNRKNYFE
jgi:hypothetical protein